MRVTSADLLKYAEMANQVITWLRSKTQLLAIMRDIQTAMRSTNPAARILTVIRPVVTRWTAYFLAYQRLLELYWVLQILLQNNRDRLTAGNAATRRKAEEMIKIIETAAFWQGLTR